MFNRILAYALIITIALVLTCLFGIMLSMAQDRTVTATFDYDLLQNPDVQGFRLHRGEEGEVFCDVPIDQATTTGETVSITCPFEAETTAPRQYLFGVSVYDAIQSSGPSVPEPMIIDLPPDPVIGTVVIIVK